MDSQPAFAVSADPVNPTSPNPARNWVLPKSYKRSFNLLLATAVVLLIVVFFIPINFEKSKPPFGLDTVFFTSVNLQDSYAGHIKNGLEKKHPQEARAQSLVKAFTLLDLDYVSFPTPYKRKVLTGLGAYIKSGFPEKYREANLTVRCLDNECAKNITLPQDLEKLQEKVIGFSLPNAATQQLQAQILVIAEAKAKGNLSLEINSANYLYEMLSNQLKNKTLGEAQFNSIAPIVEGYIRALSPEFYQLGKKQGRFKG